MKPDQLTLQERVRRFNLGTPTAMHVGTHELVNDLWRANAAMLAALIPIVQLNEERGSSIPVDMIERAYAAIAAAQPQIQREGETPAVAAHGRAVR